MWRCYLLTMVHGGTRTGNLVTPRRVFLTLRHSSIISLTLKSKLLSKISYKKMKVYTPWTYSPLSVSRTLDVSNMKLGPLTILLSKTTTRYLELSMSRTISRSPWGFEISRVDCTLLLSDPFDLLLHGGLHKLFVSSFFILFATNLILDSDNPICVYH